MNTMNTINVIERKFETSFMPQAGDTRVNGEKLYVQATGVRLKRQRITGEYFLDFDKKFFVAKDGKGNFVNGKIVGEYL